MILGILLAPSTGASSPWVIGPWNFGRSRCDDIFSSFSHHFGMEKWGRCPQHCGMVPGFLLMASEGSWGVQHFKWETIASVDGGRWTMNQGPRKPCVQWGSSYHCNGGLCRPKPALELKRCSIHSREHMTAGDSTMCWSSLAWSFSISWGTEFWTIPNTTLETLLLHLAHHGPKENPTFWKVAGVPHCGLLWTVSLKPNKQMDSKAILDEWMVSVILIIIYAACFFSAHDLWLWGIS